MQDIRYALRALRKQPIFTLVAVATLTLGIGANTAIFSLLYHLLLRPLPFPEANRLVFAWNTYPLMGLPKASVSIPDYLDRKTQAPAIEDATLFTNRNLSLSTSGSDPVQVRALAVTPSFFTTLRRQPFLGRGFVDAEAQPGADKFAILTYDLWNSRFAADRAVVGRTIRLAGEAYQVVGVLPSDFELGSRDVQLLVPFAFTPQQTSDQGRGNEFSQMIARLAPGATIEQFNGQMKTIVDRVLDRLPQRAVFARRSGFTGFAVPMRQELVGDLKTPLYILQVFVFLVLLIACANVANLLLMRATGRYRELAVRTTLGAGQWRLVRQMLTEGIVLAFFGGLGGVLVGWAGLRLLVSLSAQQVPSLANATIHPAVFAFTMSLALVTGIIFGLVPALVVLRGNMSALLKDDSRGGSASRSTGLTRTGLVIAETAFAVMLLAGAGLLIKSFIRLQDVNPGFSSDRVLTAQITLQGPRYADAPARRAFWSSVLEKARVLPGVTGRQRNAGLGG